jgi:hypothetical protein
MQCEEVPKEPKVPRVPKEPKPPRTPRVPKEPKPPRTPRVPKEPKPPRTPRVPKEPKPPKTPRVPKEPKPPRTPRVPKEPKTPKTPRVPKEPKTPKTPRVPKEPKTILNNITDTSDNTDILLHNTKEDIDNIPCDNDNTFIRTLCGNHNIYSSILIWLQKFNYDIKISAESCIIVAGPTSIGKSYSINSICNYLDYEITLIDNNNCHNSQYLKDIICKSTSSSFIQILTNNFKKKVIIIDNFDSLFISDKTINLTLLRILLENKLKNIPIICVSNNDIIKKIGDIKKVCNIYTLTTPNNDEITEILQSKDVDINNIDKLCSNSNGNLNKLFRDINNDNNDILYSDSIDYTSDINILYSTNFNRSQTKKILIKDPWMIPLKFHENLIINLNNRNISLNKYNEYYKSFMYIMCIYDYYMFKENIEFCVELFASKVYYLSILKYKNNATSNIGNFTKMLSYLSLQKKNIKNNYNIKNMPLYQLSNYHISLCNRKFISFN